MSYRHFVVEKYGGPEVVRMHESEIAEPGPDGAGIRICAAGVAFGDCCDDFNKKRPDFYPNNLSTLLGWLAEAVQAQEPLPAASVSGKIILVPAD